MAISLRKLHARRVPDLIMGSIINGTKKKVQELALKTKVNLGDGRTAFNKILRANSPSIYLVDPQLIAKTVVGAIVENDGNNKYISNIYSDIGSLTPENEEFKQEFSSTKNRVEEAEEQLIIEIINSLYAEFSIITTDQLLSLASDTYNAMIQELQKAQEQKRGYLSFRVAAGKAGANIRRELNNYGISIIVDAENIISNLNNRIAFVAYRFEAGVSEINKIIQNAINNVLAPILKLSPNFVVGNLVHAGHVGIYSDNSLLGINMPSGIIAGIATNKLDLVEQAIGSLGIHIDHGLQITQEFKEKAGAFLDLQFNFVVSMEGTLNSAILGPQEQKAIESVIGKIGEEALLQQLKSRTGVEAFNELQPYISQSPNSLEFVFQAAVAPLTKEKITPINKKGVYDGARAFTKRGNVTLNKKPSKNKTKAPSKVKVTFKKQKLKDTSIVNLLSIINRRLHDQIKSNMGTGNSSVVLNYRSGRFASSARVERISESRQGMITAFYTYMKNPYATFSRGGRQEAPASRDPKTLISKSIRELAGPLVSNRMRAVLV